MTLMVPSVVAVHSEPFPERELPSELLGKIFSYLPPCDLQVATQVSKTMKAHVVEETNKYEPNAIKDYTQVLIQNLNTQNFPKQVAELGGISGGIVRQSFTNLNALKSYISKAEGNLINVLKTVDDVTASQLRLIPSLTSIEDIFSSIRTGKRIEEADLIVARWKIPKVFFDIAEYFLKTENFDKAITVAKMISNEFWSDRIFLDISTALARAGTIKEPDKEPKEAIAIAQLISQESTKIESFRTISEILIQAGNIDQALAVANMIPDEYWKGWAFHPICRALTKSGDIARATEVANMISNGTCKFVALKNISVGLY